MKKVKNEMSEEYDFSGKKEVRGKYTKAFKAGHSVRIFDKDKLISDKFFAAIDSDVREYFTDSKSINQALRTIISIIPHKPRTATK